MFLNAYTQYINMSMSLCKNVHILHNLNINA